MTVSLTDQLMNEVVGCKLATRRFGVSRALDKDHRRQAADVFDADDALLSAGKKILDTKDTSWRGVTKVLSQAKTFWNGITLPWPEQGVRLLRRKSIDAFTSEMLTFKAELDQALGRLSNAYWGMKQAARERLGSLWNPSDYPEDLAEFFDLAWEFPTLDPPKYLMEINPAIYEQQMARVKARFDTAIDMAEQAFAEEFRTLVAHLAERLSGDEDGKPKQFRDTAVTNLHEFFERFKSLSVRSNAELDKLIAQCQTMTRNANADVLRSDTTLRQFMSESLGGIQSQLDALMADRPKRLIRKRKPAAVEA